jgi:hypothetical protein
MTWFMIDDGIYDSPQCEELPLSAIGLWALAGSYVGRQLRHGDYDGAITMQRVRKLGGSPKLARQLVDAGLWRETEPDVFEIVAANPDGTMLCKYAATKELQEKRARAGRAGGKASGRSRRSKNEAKGEALAEAKGEANAKQTGKQKRSTLTYTYSHTDITSPNPSATKTGPDATAGHQSDTTPDTRAATMADAEARIRADPLQAIAGAYPKPGPMGKPAYRERARKALGQALTDATPETLYGAALAYAKAVDNGDMPLRYAPLLANWLTGEWRSWTPQDRPRDHEWRGITSQWMRDQIHRQSPGLPITDSLEQAFWASVKSGTPALDAIRDLTAQTTKEPRP